MYKVLFEEGSYQLVKNGRPVHTPTGSKVNTTHEALARRLLDHFKAYGTSSEDWRSIAHFHYPLLDFVRHYDRSDVITRMVLSLDPYNDWTFRSGKRDSELEKMRKLIFGQPSKQHAKGQEWLKTLDEHQLCAAMVLGKDLDSINAACLVSGCQGRREEQSLLESLIVFRPELGQRPLQELVDNYNFYRGLQGKATA